MRMNQKLRMGCLVGFVCVGLVGCRSAEAENAATVLKNESCQVETLAIPDYPKEPVYKSEDERWEANYVKREQVDEKFKTALEDFSIKTASVLLTNESDNTVYSPVSLYYTLSLAAEGASGETREELLQLLGYETVDQLADDAQHYFEYIYHVPNEKNNKPNEWGEYSAESRYTLSIANSLWADKSLELKHDFLRRAEKSYYSEVYLGDMQDETMAQNMSKWVQEKTKGVFEPRVDENTQDSALTLLNTIYFYDEWLDRFDKEKTKEDVFFNENGSTPMVEFMNRTMASHFFQKGENFISSALSLKNGTMEVYLPNEGVDIYDLINTPEKMKVLLNGSGERMVGEVV